MIKIFQFFDKRSIIKDTLYLLEKYKTLKFFVLCVFHWYCSWILKQNNFIANIIVLITAFLMLIFSEDLEPQLWMKKKNPSGLDYLFKRPRNSWSLIPLGFGALITLQIVMASINGDIYEMTNRINTEGLGYVWDLVIVGPILEEIIFRKFLYKDALSQHVSYPMVLSIIIFTLLHAPTNPRSLVFYVCASTVLYTIYKESEYDIRVPLIVHMMYNFIAIL